MRKPVVILMCVFSIGFSANAVTAQVCEMHRPGSLLVYPLIDNIQFKTIIEITNRADTPIWLQGFMIVHRPGTPTQFEKQDFLIHLTQKEAFWWETGRPYFRQDADGVVTQIPAFNNRKGFMFVWAINNPNDRLEIAWNALKGDALAYSGTSGHSFQYHAIPHQGLSVSGDRVLHLDGQEYCMAASSVNVEGFAANYVGNLNGKWVVCSPDINFINSIQPEFNINVAVWNQNENYQSRHLHFYQFEEYDVADDLQLDVSSIFTPQWQFISTAARPVWAVFYQTVGFYAWGGNVWQNPDTGVPATVILPPVPPGR